MKQEKIKVLRIKPDGHPETVLVDNELSALQNEVGGLIEILDIDEDGTSLICNEEGKCLGLDLNRKIQFDEENYDIIAGTMLIAGSAYDGNLTSLSEDKLSKYSEKFFEPEYLPNKMVKMLERLGLLD